MTQEKNTQSSKPEEIVRQKILSDLKAAGWKENRLQWKPEWQIPATPHDLTKRERGQKYEVCGRPDLVAFADDSKQSYALQVIFEFKEPSVSAGKAQLQRYLAGEPVVRMGYWTNGIKSLAIYKSHTNDWIEIDNAPLPLPSDDFNGPPTNPPCWEDLKEPIEAQLSTALKRLVAVSVVQDSRSVRREEQLKELLHVLLIKIESDNIASAPANTKKPVNFRIYGSASSAIKETSDAIRSQFKQYFNKQRTRVFQQDDTDEIKLMDETIYMVVGTLASWRILGDKVDLLSKAFQIFRTQAMKSGEGQFLTPLRVIRPCVMAMDITSEDKVIDPACGSGGFLIEALRQVQDRDFPGVNNTWRLVKYANDNLYGIDKDPLGVKLTKAMMIAMQDGSTHVIRGDAIRIHQWEKKFPELLNNISNPADKKLVAAQFTVVLTNPPFGEDLVVSAEDARASGYTITQSAAKSTKNSKKDHVDLEIGLVYLELAYNLLQVGGRVGIILPETYFFSHSYRWLDEWLSTRLVLRGMLNIAMEAFEEFCRAKTNFYIFEKIQPE